MVGIHPETGRSALFVGLRGTPACTVDGMKEDEGINFLEGLREFFAERGSVVAVLKMRAPAGF